MRPRPFAVEQARRKGAMGPGVLWRKLVHHAQQVAGVALGEVKGMSPDKGGAERWSLMAFAEVSSAACTPPFACPDSTTTHAVALFRQAAVTFVDASPSRRRAVAPSLLAAAQLMNDLMDEERRR